MTLAIFSLQFKALSAAIGAVSSAGVGCHASMTGARIRFFIASLICAFLIYLTVTFLQDPQNA
jgi:hypothetical protein